MLYVRETSDTIDQAEKRLTAAVAENGFGVLGIHNLKEKLNSKGVMFQHECRVFEVCNPYKAKVILEADISISNALPCRIALYEEKGTVKISTLRPTSVLGLFNQPELESVAQEVEAAILRMIDQACEPVS